MLTKNTLPTSTIRATCGVHATSTDAATCQENGYNRTCQVIAWVGPQLALRTTIDMLNPRKIASGVVSGGRDYS